MLFAVFSKCLLLTQVIIHNRIDLMAYSAYQTIPIPVIPLESPERVFLIKSFYKKYFGNEKLVEQFIKKPEYYEGKIMMSTLRAWK
jgi:hypothetical protein